MVDGKNILLLAEDEDDLREMYCMALGSNGFEVLEAVNGREAIDWLDKRGPDIDIILMDIVMPEMDGFEALEKIVTDERFKKIPIIVSTNLDNAEDRRQALGLGAREYFVKSQHTPSELVIKIQDVLAGK